MTATTHIVRGCPSTSGNDRQLNTTTLIRHAARTHGDQEIVYRTPDGGWDRYTYADCYARVCRSANALRSLGVEPGDRVGILTGTADAISSCTGPSPAWARSCCR